jgi:hypothetical protein
MLLFVTYRIFSIGRVGGNPPSEQVRDATPGVSFSTSTAEVDGDVVEA